MTDTNLIPVDKRDQLRAKIEASERRIAERTVADQAKEAAEAATAYVKKNPLKVLGGAILIGITIGAMTGPGRRAARSAATGAANAVSGVTSGAAKTVGSAARKRGTAIGALFADAVVAYGAKLIDDALDTARAGQDKMEDISDSATARARKARREADYFVGSAADKGRAVTRKTRRSAERAVRGIKDRVAN